MPPITPPLNGLPIITVTWWSPWWLRPLPWSWLGVGRRLAAVTAGLAVMLQTCSAHAAAAEGTERAVLLAAAVIGTLWVPFYNHLTPALGGFPFFYWYQLLWVPIVAVLSAIAYLLSRRIERGNARTRRHAVPRKGPGEAS